MAEAKQDDFCNSENVLSFRPGDCIVAGMSGFDDRIALIFSSKKQLKSKFVITFNDGTSNKIDVDIDVPFRNCLKTIECNTPKRVAILCESTNIDEPVFLMSISNPNLYK